jgi:hypothetical protein
MLKEGLGVGAGGEGAFDLALRDADVCAVAKLTRDPEGPVMGCGEGVYVSSAGDLLGGRLRSMQPLPLYQNMANRIMNTPITLPTVAPTITPGRVLFGLGRLGFGDVSISARGRGGGRARPRPGCSEAVGIEEMEMEGDEEGKDELVRNDSVGEGLPAAPLPEIEVEGVDNVDSVGDEVVLTARIIMSYGCLPLSE